MRARGVVPCRAGREGRKPPIQSGFVFVVGSRAPGFAGRGFHRRLKGSFCDPWQRLPSMARPAARQSRNPLLTPSGALAAKGIQSRYAPALAARSAGKLANLANHFGSPSGCPCALAPYCIASRLIGLRLAWVPCRFKRTPMLKQARVPRPETVRQREALGVSFRASLRSAPRRGWRDRSGATMPLGALATGSRPPAASQSSATWSAWVQCRLGIGSKSQVT